MLWNKTFCLYTLFHFKVYNTNERELYVQTYKHTYIHVLSAYVHMYGPIVCSCEAGARDEGSLMRWRRECRQRRARQKQNKAGKQSIDRKSKERREQSANRREWKWQRDSHLEVWKWWPIECKHPFFLSRYCTFSLREFVVGIRRAWWNMCSLGIVQRCA